MLSKKYGSLKDTGRVAALHVLRCTGEIAKIDAGVGLAKPLSLVCLRLNCQRTANTAQRD